MRDQQGYVALISAIVISVLLITITFALSFTSFYGRGNILNSEFKKVSYGLASSCAENAMLKLALNQSYVPVSGGETLNLGSNTCKIISVTSSGSQRTIKTQSIYKNTYSNLQVLVTLSPSSLTVNRWTETP
jgi:hypothetical protein